MAPIKLEDNMKERLEERTIEPTMAAWDRISSKLDVEQGVKKSKRVLWMSIAASFVGGILMAVLFYQNTTTSQQPVMVDTNEVGEESIFVNPEEIITPQQEFIEEKEEVATIENKAINEEIISSKNKESISNSIYNTQESSKNIVNTLSEEKSKQAPVQEIKTSVETAVVVSESINKKVPAEITIDKGLNKAIAQKIEEVVAQVESKESITDAEIEELLKNAQRDIISKQIFNQKTNKVDANALLLDVEAEVAPASFRNKIFEAVVEGFEKTRSAVVNRNN